MNLCNTHALVCAKQPLFILCLCTLLCMMYVFGLLSIMLVMNGEEGFLIGMESTSYLCMGLPSRGCLPGRFKVPVL